MTADEKRPLTPKRLALAALGVTLLVAHRLREMTARDVADALWPARAKRREAEEELRRRQPWVKHLAGRCYKVAMSQASQRMTTPEERARLARLARLSFERGDQLMVESGMRPEEHPWRAGALRRMRERGA